MTALHPNSKSDTTILLDANLADIFVDYGPSLQSLGDQSTYIEDVPSPRAALGAPRNILIKVLMQSSWSGILLELGAKDYSYRISLSGGVLSFAEDGFLRVAVTVPGLSGTSRTILINWSQRVDTGAVVDDVTIGNLSTGAWAFGAGTHAASTPDPEANLTIAAGVGGDTPYTGEIGAFLAVHIGRRFRSATEAFQDWDPSFLEAAALDGYDRMPIWTGDADELQIASEGNLAGPSMLWAGSATVQAGLRAVGSLVNVHIRSPATERPIADPVRFYRAAPDGGGWQWCIRYLWHAFIGLKVNTAHVRVHVRVYAETEFDLISPVRFRVYSAAGMPLNGGPGALKYERGPIVSVTTTSVAGVWLDLGTVKLVRDETNLTYICLGFLIDEVAEEGDTVLTAWELNAITVDPYGKELSGGGLGGELDKAEP